MAISVMLAYDTPAGRATYIGGSGLAGEPQYTLGGRTLAHSAVLALIHSTADFRTDTRRFRILSAFIAPVSAVKQGHNT